MTRDRGSSQDDTHVSPALLPTVICGIYKTVATMSVTLSSLGVLFNYQRTSLVFDALLKALVETEHFVELIGIEPTTSGLQSRRSPS